MTMNNEIQIKTEQTKKVYTAPEMEIVELMQQTELLEGSPFKGPIE